MRKLLFTLLSTSIFAASCKKEATAPPQQQVTVKDYDTRRGLANTEVDTYLPFNAFDYGSTPLQYLRTDADGKVSFQVEDDARVTLSAQGYLTRDFEMRYAKGDIEMLKSAKIELKCVNANLIQGSIHYIDIKCKPDLQLGAMIGEETIVFQTYINRSMTPQVFSFMGAAGKVNNLSISYETELDSLTTIVRDTVFHVTPALTGTTHVEFNY